MLMVGTVHALPTARTTLVIDMIASEFAVRMLAVYVEIIHASACHLRKLIICEVLEKGRQLPAQATPHQHLLCVVWWMVARLGLLGSL